MFAVTLSVSALIGVLLGLLGGGGAILAVPALVYLSGIAPQDAVGMSLAIVGTASLMGAVLHRRQGNVDGSVALAVGGAGLIGAFGGARLTALVPGPVLMLLFAVLMLMAGTAMLRRRSHDDADPSGQRPGLAQLLLVGVGVGGVTGFLGVGGGFLLVPALTLLAGLPMRLCTGTSLAIIAINAAAGIAGHWGEGDPHLALTAAMTVTALAGVLAGERLARFVPPATLRRTFALFVIATGLLVGLANVTKLV